VYEKQTRDRLGLEARLRFSSYDRAFLEQILVLLGGGSITKESRAKGPYYRLTLTGYYRVERTLSRMIPYLVRKKEIVNRWLLLHRAKAEIGRIQRRLRLKRGEYLRSELRQTRRMADQLMPPPLKDMD
jgi:hypothetical protein